MGSLRRIVCGCLLLAADGAVTMEAAFAQPQQYVISTYAGAQRPPSASMSVGAIATDAVGDFYFAGFSNTCTCVFKLDPAGNLTRVAGSAQRGFSGDGGPATNAQLGDPLGLALDSAGNLFIADQAAYNSGYNGQDRIRKVSLSGIITTVAGGGTLSGSAADGGLATNAQLYYPIGVAVDGAGNLFFAESVDDDEYGNNRIRKVSPDGIITTVAGNGMYGFSGDGGPATSAQLAGPSGLAIDSSGNLFFSDFYNNRVREVSAADGTINTVVNVNPPGSNCCLEVTSVAVDAADNLFYGVNPGPLTVFERSPDGVTTTTVPNDSGVYAWWLAVDGAGNLFLNNLFLNGAPGVLRVAPDGSIAAVVGGGSCCYAVDGGPATAAQLLSSNSVAADGSGNLFIADAGNHRIRRVTPDGIINTAVGDGMWNVNCDTQSGANGPAASAQLCSPSQVAVDSGGNIFIVDRNRIRKVSPDGTIASIAGDGTIGTGGDGGPATQAQLAYPNSVAADSGGNIYFAEYARVRKITPDGIISTVAGTGSTPSSNGCYPPASPGCGPPPVGDGQPATSVPLFNPTSVIVDTAGNVYFIDGLRVRQVSPSGIITTAAGNGGRAGYQLPTGDGGLATNVPLWSPNGVTVDSAGNLYISEPVRVRKVTTDGIIYTIAGSQDPGYSGDGGPATQAQLWNPTGLTVDGAGDVYIADSFNNVIRVLRPVQ